MMRRVFDQFEVIVGGSLLVALSLVALAQVGSRYVLASPLAWTEELGRVLFVWLVFIGASLALKRHEHFALEIMIDALPAGPQRVAKTFVHLLVVLFCVLLIGYGTELAVDNWDVRTAVLEIRRTWLYLAVPVGGALMLIRAIESGIRVWLDDKDAAAAEQPGASDE